VVSDASVLRDAVVCVCGCGHVVRLILEIQLHVINCERLGFATPDQNSDTTPSMLSKLIGRPPSAPKG